MPYDYDLDCDAADCLLIGTGEDAQPPMRWDPALHIPRDSLFQAYEGIRYANYLGSIFNVAITINWQCEGYESPASIDRAYRMFMDRYKKFCSHRNEIAFYWTVFERGETVGLHSHSGIALPWWHRNQFRSWFVHSLVNFDGRPFERASYSVRIRSGTPIISQWKWFRYCFKSVDPTMSATEKRRFGEAATVSQIAGLAYQPGGFVPFKRVRLCRAFGSAARRKAGYASESIGRVPQEHRYGDDEYRRGLQDRQNAELRSVLLKLEVLV